jgi:hypothetical protein
MAIARHTIGSAFAVVVLALGAAGCGSQGRGDRDRFDPATPRRSATPPSAGGADDLSAGEPITAAERAVVVGWTDSLRHGRVSRAARYFALPAVVANGTPPLAVRTRAQAEAFNRALPCGAEVVSLRRTVHHYVLATLRLTERPGPGTCGAGTGALARTAFRVERRHITQWLRVPTAAEQQAPTNPS